MCSFNHQFTVEGGKKKQKGKGDERKREMEEEREERMAGERRVKEIHGRKKRVR